MRNATRSSPYHPEGNGQAERSIQSAKTLIRCVAAEENIPKYAWPSILQRVAFMHNATVNTSTKYTPYKLMYGTKPQLPSTKCSPEIDPPVTADLDGHVEETQYNIDSKWDKAALHLNKAKQDYKRYYEEYTKTKDVKTGEFVYIRNNIRGTALDPLFIGPYKVMSVNGHTVAIRDPRRGIRSIHMNNCCQTKCGDIVLLPSADNVIDAEGDTEMTADVRGQGNTDIHYEDLDIPITIRKSYRNEPKCYGDDFTT